MLFPFSDFHKKETSNLIVNIIEEDLSIFETKVRAPYKILIETIDVNELKTKKKKEIKEEEKHEDKEDDLLK